MKMATLGRVGWNLGGLAKVAVSGAFVLGGAAFAQPTLDITIDAPDTATPGETVVVNFSIFRTDGGAASLDADVKAIGAEITLPSGWKLERDPDANCDATISDNQQAGVNSTIRVKGDEFTFNGDQCFPIPTTGDILEVFWIPEEGGNGDPLPVAFPINVTATFTVPAQCDGAQNINGTVKYRVNAGAEQTENGTDSIECDGGSPCPTSAGDADGNGAVDTADVQAAFEYFLNPATQPGVNAFCADFCGTGNGVDTADVQGIFVLFLGVDPTPCD